MRARDAAALPGITPLLARHLPWYYMSPTSLFHGQPKPR